MKRRMKLSTALFYIIITGILSSLVFIILNLGFDLQWSFISFLLGGIFRMIFILITDL